MRIHVWGINYSPEVTGIAPYNAALCEKLLQAGHSVRMVTSFCYYPAWQKLPSEKNLFFRTDDLDGVPVHRCWHYVPKKVTTFKRMLHEGSFVISSFFRQLFLGRPDLVVVISPPLLLGAAAWLLCKLKRSQFIFHVHDLQPDAAAGLGMLKDSPLLSALRWLERFAYRKAVRVSGITPGMIAAFHSKGVPPEKCTYFPNGVEIPEFWRLPERGLWRKSHGFTGSDFLVVYSGNIGRKQGLDTLLHAASQLRDSAIRFLICGDGVDLQNLKFLAAKLALTNVSFLPLQPEPYYKQLLVDSDVSIIPQRPGCGSCFFPSKLLTTLAFSSPVLAVTEPETELARAVSSGGFGVVVSPESPASVASALEQLSSQRERLREMGRAGFKFVKQYELNALVDDFRVEVESLEKECGWGKTSRTGTGAETNRPLDVSNSFERKTKSKALELTGA